MQEPAGRRPAPPFAGVDLRRPKGYPAPTKAEQPAQALGGGDPCPRCESRDTKFCYYNNYNTSQPRHFCKSCRRYWTKGGSLRNVPVGGGTRKQASTSSSSSPASPDKSPKRSKTSKRRRVAPAPDPAPPTADAANAAPTTPTPAPSSAGPAAAVAAEAPAAPAPSTGAVATVAAEAPGSTQAAATVAAEVVPAAPAPPAAADAGSAYASVALGLGLTDAGSGGGGNSKELLPDPGHFEWPSGCDLVGPSYWGAGVFGDADPALFLNLP